MYLDLNTINTIDLHLVQTLFASILYVHHNTQSQLIFNLTYFANLLQFNKHFHITIYMVIDVI